MKETDATKIVIFCMQDEEGPFETMISKRSVYSLNRVFYHISGKMLSFRLLKIGYLRREERSLRHQGDFLSIR